jgi:hypothetical protein
LWVFVVFLQLDHNHALLHADLGGCQADAGRLAHGLAISSSNLCNILSNLLTLRASLRSTSSPISLISRFAITPISKSSGQTGLRRRIGAQPGFQTRPPQPKHAEASWYKQRVSRRIDYSQSCSIEQSGAIDFGAAGGVLAAGSFPCIISP